MPNAYLPEWPSDININLVSNEEELTPYKGIAIKLCLNDQLVMVLFAKQGVIFSKKNIYV